MWGRSRCPKCKHPLNAIDLVPLFSCLITRCKCRYCKKPISKLYPALEFVMGVSFLITAIMTGFENSLLLAYYLLITFIFVLLSFYDAMYQEVPDEISVPIIIVSGLMGYLLHLNSPADLLVGFLVPVLFFSILFLGSRGRWLGGGDVRIGAIMGFLLGWPNVITGLFLGYLLGAVYSVFGLLSGRLTRKSLMPFGPFLFLGTYIALFWGKDIISWYMGMM
jgi:prepilin signal peptidase PulO-like enzyme (type II secretory pathway)